MRLTRAGSELRIRSSRKKQSSDLDCCFRLCLFFFGDGRANVLSLVDVQDPVQMVHLMLQAARKKIAASFHGDFSSAAIQPGADHALVTREIADHSRYGQASLNRFDLAFCDRKLRIDEYERPVILHAVLQVDDENAL